MTISVTARTEIGRLTIGRIIRKKICRSVAPSTRADSMTSPGMLFTAAERMTVANPTDPHMPTAISAKLTRWSSPSHEIGAIPKLPRIALRRPMFASGEYTNFQITASAVAAIAIGMKTIALRTASYRTRAATTAMISPRKMTMLV